MYEVVYVENKRIFPHFLGGLIDCRNYLFTLLFTEHIEHYVESPYTVKTRSGYFQIREVDFHEELKRLQANSYTMDIVSDLQLDWNRNAHLNYQGRNESKPVL